MISQALVLLKDLLNTYLSSGPNSETSAEDQVVFLSGQKMDPLTFTVGKISVLLINIEEENTLRQPDPYLRIAPNGAHQKVNPEIRLNLFVLFVANYNDYEDSLRVLSQIIRYFQNHRVIDHQNSSGLPQDIEKLIIGLVTLPFAEQNEVWSSLRVTYHPSVLYKVRMVVFKDDEAAEGSEISETGVQTS
jgi:hypothetical protein